MSADFAGTLCERVTLLAPSAGRDALGGADEDWTVRDVVWAAVALAGHGASVAGDAAATLPVWRVTMRPCGIAVGDRIELAWATVDVREVRSDPRLPDRVVAIGEERR